MENDRNELEKERLDRNLNELLGELRVALPGVQVLFAFLLAVPFNQGFTKVSAFEKSLYFATLLTTAVAAGLLIAPSSLHRIMFRQDDKHYIVFTSNRLAIAGFAVLGVAMTLATVLISHYLYGQTAAIVVAIAVGALILGLWYVLPLARLRRLRAGSR
jgi:hypothetical protein